MIAKLNIKPRVEWEAIRRRLASAAQALQSPEGLAPEAAAELLARRARELERSPPAEPPATELLHLVTFTLAAERYAIETDWVREIVRLADYTHLPGAPPFVTGVFNLRGEIIAIVDLRRLFATTAGGLADLPHVIVLGRDRAEFGILAVEVEQVAPARRDKLLEPSLSIPAVDRELVKGVTRDALIVLDGGRLLSDPRLYVNLCPIPRA